MTDNPHGGPERPAASDGPPVARTHIEAAQVLRDKCASERAAGHWRPWQDVALRLADHRHMAPAWREFLKRDPNPYILVNAAEEAYRHAGQDVRRPSSAEELAQLKRVRDAATELMRAVEAAPLPSDYGMPFDGPSRPWSLLLGWKGDTQRFDEMAKVWHIPASLLLTDLMATVETLIDRHLEKLPVRAIKRDESKRSTPRLTAFVRRLTWGMNCEFGEGMPSTVGRVAAALFDLPEILTKRQVEKKLADMPEPLSAPRARAVHAMRKGAAQPEPSPPEGCPP
jgi:hypothetical protein